MALILGVCLLAMFYHMIGIHGSTFVVPPTDCVYLGGQILKNEYDIEHECGVYFCLEGEVEYCTLSKPGCDHQDTRCMLLPSTGECVYKDQVYADGSTFETDDCFVCSCNKGHVRCEGTGNVIKDYYEALCKIVKEDKCNERAVLKSDESKPCPCFSATTH